MLYEVITIPFMIKDQRLQSGADQFPGEKKIMENIKTPVIIGCDHAAYGLKEKVKAWLADRGISVEDAGAFSDASVDYPDFGRRNNFV